VLPSSSTGTQGGSDTPIEPAALTKLFFVTVRLLSFGFQYLWEAGSA
jgi:hypothetical protein